MSEEGVIRNELYHKIDLLFDIWIFELEHQLCGDEGFKAMILSVRVFQGQSFRE